MDISASNWVSVLPIAVSAWVGAAALGYLLLLPGSLRPVRVWSLGFLTLGAALFFMNFWSDVYSLPHLLGRAGVVLAICLIGKGVLDHLLTELSSKGPWILAGLVALFLVIGMADPYLRTVGILGIDATLSMIAIGLAGFCLVKRRTRLGRGLRFMGIAFSFAALEPLVYWSARLGFIHGDLHDTYLIGYTLTLSLGTAILALRGLQLEAQESESRLRWTEERFELALRGASDGVWDWDLPSDSVVLTPRLLQICRIDTDRRVFTSGFLKQYIHPSDFTQHNQAISEVLQGQCDSFQTEFRLMPRDGDKEDIWCLNRGLAVRGPGGRVLRMAGTITDVTERKRFEGQLIAAKEQAELASRSKSDFLAHMSHELRTPLNAIIGFSDMTRQELYGPIEDKRYVDYADTINMAGQHLLQIISDIIDISKIESGQTKIDDILFDAEEVFQSSLGLMAPKAKEGGVRLQDAIDAELPWMRGDAIRVKQIVLNLLSNAIKFTPEGGAVRLAVRETHQGGVFVSVSDTGVGIAKKDIPTVLSRFGRLDSPYIRSQDGMGLGLTLVQMFATLHDASFDFQSQEGDGTTVTVIFPPHRVQRREGTSAHAAE